MAPAIGSEGWPSPPAVVVCLREVCVVLDRATKVPRSVRGEMSHLRTVRNRTSIRRGPDEDGIQDGEDELIRAVVGGGTQARHHRYGTLCSALLCSAADRVGSITKSKLKADANLCVRCGAGGVWAAAAGASVAYSRRRAPSLIHGRKKALMSLVVLGGAAAAWMHYRNSTRREREQMDLDFYSQLPPATDAGGNENERWSW
ncbi:hypothetical protein HU200_030609 [Digitaria exilis]|uniref:Uncharacterized protein n=1 Tax=Digitaria exilis TaxID=1010633 RepID=A0A835ERW2_9POAL|nr:hypothetical protein HU200_030609 [Digitaria exilis]